MCTAPDHVFACQRRHFTIRLAAKGRFCLRADEQKMALLSEEFHRRIARIPAHGIGLSVDVYSPDVFSLLDELELRGLTYGYLEVFKASSRALGALRRRIPDARLAYHGEGIWLTQPDLRAAYPIEHELRSAASHLHALASAWINHECASKQIAGYSFGTYVPPLFTHDAAVITAWNARYVQQALDQLVDDPDGAGPLLLLEMPPLTYFKFGDLGVQEFFDAVVHHASCGLVLDVGHLWTVYRYSGGSSTTSLRSFVATFLDRFPLERVVQIHVAGLGPGATSAPPLDHASRRGDFLIDAHACPIPEVLFDMLDLILAHPRLCHLRGVALEVDTKPIGAIVAEFETFGKRYGERVHGLTHRPSSPRSGGGRPPSCAEQEEPECAGRVLALYDAYARAISGRVRPTETALPVGDQDGAGLDHYSRAYLPAEILDWGGTVRDIFPETCRRLDAEGISLVSFVGFWFRAPRPVTEPYDFFLIKLDRFVEFIRECLPQAEEQARREAQTMREAYSAANDVVSVCEE